MGATLTANGGKQGASALIGYLNRHGELPPDQLYTVNLSIDNHTAQQEMRDTRELFNKTGGIQAHHWVQSFDDSLDKTNPQDIRRAHEAGVALVDQIATYLPNHEIYMATHTDSKGGYIHNHIAIGSLNLETGKKLHSNKELNYTLKDLNDKVLAQFGMAQPVEKYQPIDYELHAEGKLSLREQTKHMVLLAKQQATSFDEFKAILKNEYNVTVYEYGGGKRIGYNWQQENGELFTIGARKLGSDFERPAIEAAYAPKEQLLSRQETEQTATKAAPSNTPLSDYLKKIGADTSTYSEIFTDIREENHQRQETRQIQPEAPVSPEPSATPAPKPPKQTPDQPAKELLNLAKKIAKEGQEKELRAYERDQQRRARQRQWRDHQPDHSRDNDWGY